ncbi:MAG TPA: hypothetical protein VFZ59_14525 [Verrucomicrobiae bacterium]|nr:hypothetical protein [Verrucomicrobiae bacterium]
MSLKAFHVIFITSSSLMLFGFGAWMLRAYRGPEGVTGDLAWAVAAIVAGLSLLVYEGFFLRKLKNVSYL